MAGYIDNGMNGQRQWHYLAVTTKGARADDGASVYFDGVSRRYELEITTDDQLEGDGNLRINGEKDYWIDNKAFTYVDELTFWNRNLSTDEVEIECNSCLWFQLFNYNLQYGLGTVDS